VASAWRKTRTPFAQILCSSLPHGLAQPLPKCHPQVVG